MRPLAICLALAALGAACAPGPAAPAAPVSTPAPTPAKLVAGFSNISPSNWPLWIAKDGGIFEKNLIDAEVTLVEGGARTMAALLAGQLQIAHVGGSEVVSATAAGADLVVIGVVVPVWPYVLIAAPEIKSAEDLRGKKVGIVTVGGSFDIAARVALPKIGLTPDEDVTLIATGSTPNVTAALLSGAVQAGLAQPPDQVLLGAKGYRVLVDLGSLNLPTAANSMVLQRSSVAANRALAQRYADSIVEAIARARKDRAFAVAVLKKYFKLEDDKAANAAYDHFIGRVIPAVPLPQKEQFADAIEQLSKTNEKVRGFDATKIIDDSFMKGPQERGLDKR